MCIVSMEVVTISSLTVMVGTDVGGGWMTTTGVERDCPVGVHVFFGITKSEQETRMFRPECTRKDVIYEHNLTNELDPSSSFMVPSVRRNDLGSG